MKEEDDSTNSRKSTSKAPPQIVTFFSKTANSNEQRTSSSNPANSLDRKRKSSPQRDEPEDYIRKLRKNADRISKIKKTKKVDSAISAFFQKDDELSDFESPNKRVRVKTPPVIKKKKISRKRKQTDSQKAKNKQDAVETNIFEKVLLYHSSADGVNSDDLQLALALSRSLKETHNSQPSESSNDIADVIRNAGSSNKIDVVRKTIEKFGFKKRDNNDYDFKDFFTIPKKNKKWLSKFTPLTRRLDNLQKQKFARKVKNILKMCDYLEKCDGESNPQYHVTSSYLQPFFIPNSPTYNMHSVLIDTKVEEFYVKDLVPISTVRCGCMLKNWADIPGRDASPQRTSPSDILKSHDANEQLEAVSVGNSTSHNFVDVAGLDAVSEIETEHENISQQHASQSVTIKPSYINDTTISSQDTGNNVSLLSVQTEQLEMVKTASTTPFHIATVGNVDFGFEVERRNTLLRSPDMFDGCESSPNTTLNDDTSLMNISDHLSLSRNISLDNLNFKSVGVDEDIPPGSSSLNKSNSEPNDDLECQLSTTSNEIQIYEITSGESRGTIDKDIEPTSQQANAIIMLSSDESNQGTSNISQTNAEAIQARQQKIDYSLGTTRAMVKQLSFTERLLLYSNDPSINFDDHGICSQTSQSYQNSIVLSDDEINYSMNRSTVGGTPHERVSDEALTSKANVQSFESIELSDSGEDNVQRDVSDDEKMEDVSFVSIDGVDAGEGNDGIVTDVDLNVNEMNREEVNGAVKLQLPNNFLLKTFDTMCERRSPQRNANENIQSFHPIELSDNEDCDDGLESEDEVEPDRVSFISIACHGSDSETERNNDPNLNNEIHLNLSARSIRRKDSVVGSTTKSFLRTTSDTTFERSTPIRRNISEHVQRPYVQSFVSCVLSDSDIEEVNAEAAPSHDQIAEECDACTSEISLDYISDDEIIDLTQPLNKENLINLSVKEMCQEEFVTSSKKASSTKKFQHRTTSEMTFGRPRMNVRNTSMRSDPIQLSEDEFDEFDALVKGHQILSKTPPPKTDSRGDDFIALTSPPKTPIVSNEFVVQSMDQIFEVRTGILITPKPDYENMDSPTRLEHLKKYGLKPLGKRKAVICLEHIYNRLHPFIELDGGDEVDSVLNKKKLRLPVPVKVIADRNVSPSEQFLSSFRQPPILNCAESFDNNIVEKHVAHLQDADFIFLPSAPRRKKPWCLQPLHIAWHNLINANPAIFDQILQFKPVDLVEIRTMLKSVELLYETNDIIAFLDRKCITFKTDSKRNKVVKINGK